MGILQAFFSLFLGRIAEKKIQNRSRQTFLRVCLPSSTEVDTRSKTSLAIHLFERDELPEVFYACGPDERGSQGD